MSATKYFTFFIILSIPSSSFGEDVLFADQFKGGLSPKWENVGLKKGDFRFHKDGGLELRVQPGKPTKDTPILKVILPFKSETDTVIATVKITVLNEFTEENELAGVYLIDEGGIDFGAKQERVNGKQVYSPPKYRFNGKPNERGDPDKYIKEYTPTTKEANVLRVTVDRGNAFAQFGPFEKDSYITTFHSAVGKAKQRGFCLSTSGAPKEGEHWVRFENFKVFKN